jgi:alanine dehydrogenase
MECPTPLEELADIATQQHTFTIGLPTCDSPGEHRFPLTPEAVEMLIDRGFIVKMQHGAAASINYGDYKYINAGAKIVDRREAFNCDIVLHLAPISHIDAGCMRRGAMLLTLLQAARQDAEAVLTLLERGIISIALDLITDGQGNLPFNDILAEIDGRAAVAIASSLLADPAFGKGILLGGIAGIVPCEVTIIGSGIAACAAARSAVGLGAIVRMFDDDVYRLRAAMRELGAGVIGSALQPHVLVNALRSADVVVTTPITTPYVIHQDVVNDMKEGVVVFDLSQETGTIFPSLPVIDLGSTPLRDSTATGRLTYIHAGNAIPRTAAMALSNTFLTFMTDIITCDGITNALKLLPGIQRAAYTFMGKIVNKELAEKLNVRHIDINLILRCS